MKEYFKLDKKKRASIAASLPAEQRELITDFCKSHGMRLTELIILAIEKTYPQLKFKK